MTEQMAAVKVIDSVMGSGKTTYAINMIEQAGPLDRFIFITPFLDECDRIINTVKSRQFITPSTKISGGSKLTHLKKLIEEGKDIVATHALFEMADEELFNLLKQNGYSLILDEVMSVIDKAPVSNADMRLLLDMGYVHINEGNSRVEWRASEAEYDDGRFTDIKLMALAGTLYYYRNKFLVYAFPPKIFGTFVSVHVLTYLFDAQFMRYYFNLYDIPYEKYAVKDGEIVEYNPQIEGRAALRELINVYEGKLNDFANTPTALSSTWLKRRSIDELDVIRKNMYNYVRAITGAKAKEVLWTTLKQSRPFLSGRGYAKSFASLNLRATNEYADRTTLMYVSNRYINPDDSVFFQDNGITVDQDLWALSEMLQWIWRGAIRKGEEINLYLPSSRMRGLLEKWAKYEI